MLRRNPVHSSVVYSSAGRWTLMALMGQAVSHGRALRPMCRLTLLSMEDTSPTALLCQHGEGPWVSRIEASSSCAGDASDFIPSLLL